MSYETKMESLVQILEDHNKAMQVSVDPALMEPKPVLLDPQIIKNKLLIMGATSELALSQCSFEDLQECGIPKLLAKTVAQVFRGSNTAEQVKSKDATQGFVSDRAADRMTYEELLHRYNPNEENAVYKKLAQLGKGQAFLVFREGNEVDGTTSAMLLSEIKAGFGERPLGGISVEGVMKPIYKVGQKPDNLVDENPLYSGRALRPDGTCDQLNRSWAGVSPEIRLLAYYIATKGVMHSDAHNILDICLSKHSEDAVIQSLNQRYPDAALVYQSAKKRGTLPTLKIELGKQVNRTFPKGKKIEL